MDSHKINWTDGTKQNVVRNRVYEFTEENIRQSLYRPFSKKICIMINGSMSVCIKCLNYSLK